MNSNLKVIGAVLLVPEEDGQGQKVLIIKLHPELEDSNHLLFLWYLLSPINMRVS